MIFVYFISNRWFEEVISTRRDTRILPCTKNLFVSGFYITVTLEEGVFVESALKMQCHIHKNTLLHIAFSAILPAGYCLQIVYFLKRMFFFNRMFC